MRAMITVALILTALVLVTGVDSAELERVIHPFSNNNHQ